ncbi:MAG: hypothetical protein QCI00_06355, partial [Candidatus Thermoplasmatota archaeon]|nr:hypothetical protein [Candidatus Thermoplasmatota archaeon]
MKTSIIDLKKLEEQKKSNLRTDILLVFAVIGLILISGCLEVPREEKWGIYVLDLSTGGVELIYSSNKQIGGLNLDSYGARLAFSKKNGTEMLDTSSEIFTIDTDGMNLKRLTNNNYFDAYPSFSPDSSKIVFISKRNATLDLYVMNSNGDEQQKLYDSGGHDSDVNWGSSEIIVFTRNHQIWSLHSDGTDPKQITDPLNAGQWGTANLPIGDYDPRLSPDDTKIVFERLEDPDTRHGGYNLFIINVNGTGETRLTNNFYTLGLPSWSHSGDKIVYIASVINDVGVF